MEEEMAKYVVVTPLWSESLGDHIEPGTVVELRPQDAAKLRDAVRPAVSSRKYKRLEADEKEVTK
jgi:hypothetical protein